MITKIINFIIFQTGWLVAVYYHNDVAALFCILLAIFNFSFSEHRFLASCLLGFILTLIGLTNDYALVYFKIISFPNQHFNILPFWLISIWLLFISTLDSSLGWLSKTNIFILCLVSGVGGALSYCAGAKLGAITYNNLLIPEFIFHFINWSILLPVILMLKRTLSNRLIQANSSCNRYI